MAVVRMQRVTVLALLKNRKGILEALQRTGAVDVTDLPVSDDAFEKAPMLESRASFKRSVANAEQALNILNDYCGKDTNFLSAFAGRKPLSVNDYEIFIDERSEMMQSAYRIISMDKRVSEIKGEILKKRGEQIALRPWVSLPVPTDFSGTASTDCFIGSAQGEIPLHEIVAQVAEKAGDKGTGVDISCVSASKTQTCIFAVFLKEDKKLYTDIFAELSFSPPAVKTSIPPSELILQYDEEIQNSEREIEKLSKEIRTYAGVRNAMRFMIDYYTMRDEKYEVIGKLLQSPHAFVLTGYLPAGEEEALKHALRNYEAYLQFDAPGEEEETPVLLKNNAFAEPVESVVESYALPAKGEIDPTSATACFYYFLFGLMLSDAGYGALMVLACGGALLKFKNMERSMKKSLKMFLYCGISTTFWGLMFGSFFGDVIQVVSRTFFGQEVAFKPIWFEPVKDPMRMLMFAFAVGIVHIFTGLALKLYSALKHRDYGTALYDVGFWYLLLVGLLILLCQSSLFADISGMTMTFPAFVSALAVGMAAIGAVGILFTGGRESKNPVKRLLKGAYALYGVTSYLSDVLSYSRLLALGLATGIIATVVNQMGSMMGGGIAGAIIFVVVFVVGHSINFSINLLGAYVHTNRLQFAEFFGKFYEGGGRKFNPFGIHTKYYQIREDQ